MFVADSGLFVTLAFWDKAYTDNVIYDKLLSDKLAAISVTMPSGSSGSYPPNRYQDTMKGLYAHLSSWHIDPCRFP